MAEINQYYDYLTDRGVIVPDTSVILTEIENKFKEIWGQNLDTAPTTPQGRLIEMFQRSRTFTIQCMAAISNMFNLNRASGFILDDLGALFLISRQGATYTTTSVVLGGVPGTLVPAGTRFQNTQGAIFELTADYTLGASTTPTVRAQESGLVACPENSITIILDNVGGLETVNNPYSAQIGQDVESDAEFRLRIKNSLNINSIAVLSAIKANLEALPGVLSTYCYDNYTNQAVTIDTITVPAHSILAVVDGGDKNEIAQVLYNKKTAGAGYCGASSDPNVVVEKVTVTDPNYGTAYDVSFARPAARPLAVNITVTRQGYTGADLEGAVVNAIVNWANGQNPEVDGLKIGGVVSPFEISAAVSSELSDIFINNVEIGDVDGSLSSSTITLDETEKATIDVSDIQVEVIN